MPKPFLSRSLKRRRWSHADAQVALEALARSGLSVTAFAAREGINHQRLRWWHGRVEQKTTGASSRKPVAFVEVRHREPERIEIVLRSGRVLRCAEEIDTMALRRLVDGLEQDLAC